ncbi:MAG: 3-dehydroquinate synthase [Hyphomonadaceae bacterium]|nr:3-dehydroquinate synthase [Hyphomonadaceae bacterium]
MADGQDLARRVRVGLGERSYDITIGAGITDQLGSLLVPLVKSPRVFVLTDETVAGHHLETVRAQLSATGLNLDHRAIAPGEASKCWRELEATLDWLLEAGAHRGDILIALGGGVVGDLAGLTAALMKRGMSLVQMPTTLLAQVDSSVGGKTAINTRQGKNLVGAFYQPSAVIIDTDFLATLPARERAAGYAEVVKYGLLGDAEFFDWLEVHGEAVMALEPDAIAEAIARSCQAKADIVAQDEREGGVRALLNLGHTFGHALEAENGYGPELLHGEGVACGMALAMRYSVRLDLMTLQDAARAEAVLKRAGLTTRLSDLAGGPYPPSRLIAHMRQDKKVRGNSVPLILARGIGHAFIHPDSDLADVEAFLKNESGR